MKGLKEAMEEAERELDEMDTIRELALKASRDILRRSKQVISMIHRGEDVIDVLRELRKDQSALLATLSEHPKIKFAGYVGDAMQEFTEAMVLYSIFNEEPIPTSEELRMDAASFVMGVADVIGELRRSALDSLKEGNIEKAELRFSQMEEIYEIIMGINYPAAVVNIRQKQDIGRALIEKTRGEIAISKRMMEMERKME